MDINEAKKHADYFLQRLIPACERIEIVGSLKRRDKTDVHDIEFLLIPKNQRPVPEFGKPKIYNNILEKILADLHYEEKLRHALDKKDGEKYKKRAIVGAQIGNDFCIDLFIVNASTWGIQNVIRTGPGLFSHRFVTNQNQKAFDRTLQRSFDGFLPNHLEYIKGETAIRPRDSILNLELPEERDAIEILGLGWIPPEDRRKWAMR